MPVPGGGKIEDGVYDLVAIREYVAPVTRDGYQRSAIQFSVGATQAEQTAEAVPFSFTSDDPPHRLMNVEANDPTSLHFTVTCPDKTRTIFPSFVRGYEVSGSQLWIFQKGWIDVYAPRL
jgi:hypothetical protein